MKKDILAGDGFDSIQGLGFGGTEIVHHYCRMAGIKHLHGRMTSNIPGSAGDQYHFLIPPR